MKTQSATQRNGDDLVQRLVVGFGGFPVLGSVKHLRDENGLDKSRSHKRTRRSVATIDPGDEVGSEPGFDCDGVELLIPLAVALEDEAEVFVRIDEVDWVRVQSDGMMRETRL